MPHDPTRPANRLGNETSPYLLQHAFNPVDWFPWSSEAFEKAETDDKPIFLSVGYSACHWCHVMERESFENESIAAYLNEYFISIKVDREERPDVDQIYMNAVQAMTGHGGWPMSVFMTPDGKPFFGGTYYPPRDARGMPGFDRVLSSVLNAWKERREAIETSAVELTRHLAASAEVQATEGSLEFALIDNAVKELTRAFDPIHGGFGSAPKFPHPMDLRLLLRQHHRTGDVHALHIVTKTLDQMSLGGIYDHLGGGFARYSTDAEWLVPHFEKMLYDNALLGSTLIETYQVTGEDRFARVARETFDYVLDRMTAPEGAFYATEDADSEGVEGKYYVWTLPEVMEVLGEGRGSTFARVFDVTPGGNWEGNSILNLPKPIESVAAELDREPAELRAALDEDRAKLLRVREQRVPPGKDTKVLTSWNGLMIAALADGGRALGEPRYIDAAAGAAAFLLDNLRTANGRLLHSYKDGQARFNAYLDDYANLIDGLTRLFEATGTYRWIASALELTEIMVKHFQDEAKGGFYYTSDDHETLIARTKDADDNATPSGNAMAATALARLGALTGRAELEETARRALQSILLIIQKAPRAAGQSLIALDFLLGSVQEIAVIAGDDRSEFVAAFRLLGEQFRPNVVVARSTDDDEQRAELTQVVPLLAGRTARQGRVSIYICENFSCQAPLIGIDELESEILRQG